MSNNLNLNDRRSTGATNAQEVFSPQKDASPTNEYLTEVSNNEGDYVSVDAPCPPGRWCQCIVTPTERRFTWCPGAQTP